MNAIEIRGLTKAYKDFELSGLDLTLPSGCIMGLVGENGAGKSTTIKLMLNMLRRDGGTVALLGRETGPDMTALKQDIGVVLDEPGFPESLTAKQVANVMRRVYANWDDAAYNGYLDRFAVPKGKRVKEYSRGMKMKLAIAVALSHGAKLLLLDEATSGLDPVVRDEILDIFMEFTRNEEHSILISSHIVSDLEKACDYIAFLHRGRLMLSEEKDKLREAYGMLHCASEEFKQVPASAIAGKRVTPYGVDAIVKRSELPAGFAPERGIGPVSIEELFVLMVKGED